MRRSSARSRAPSTFASTASLAQRFVTIMIRPSCGLGMGQAYKADLPDGGRRMFCGQGLDATTTRSSTFGPHFGGTGSPRRHWRGQVAWAVANTDLLPVAPDATLIGTTFPGSPNDLPEVPARKRRGSAVLRGMRFRHRACLCGLWRSGFPDGQILLAMRPTHGPEFAEILVFALDGAETAHAPPPR